MRLAQGPGTGKALLFNNIKDYNTPGSRCRRIFGAALNNYRRIAMLLGLPPTPIRASWSGSAAPSSPAASRRRS